MKYEMIRMLWRKLLFIIVLSGIALPNKVYVAMQMLDQVGILNMDTHELIETVDIDLNDMMDCSEYSTQMDCEMATQCEWMNDHCMESMDNCMDILDEMECTMSSGCEWMMNMCMESDDGGMNMGNNTPHFIAIDETNGYWFVSAIASGYIGRYDVESDQYIDKVFVDDSPAILTINENLQKLYCSRMMPMGGMMEGSESTIIQEIDYSSQNLITTNEFTIPSPAPHGITINSDGSEVYVASNTADWIYKIIPETGEIIGSVMDESVSNPENIETQRLKPIQCESVNDSLLFVTCSGGIWFDAWTGNQEHIPGKLQMWGSDNLELIDEFEFEWYSTPWHLIKSPIENTIYVVLSGDQLYEGSAGVVSISFTELGLEQNWFLTHDNFSTLHGIDISKNGETLYISGRGDGHLHIISTDDGTLVESIPLSPQPEMVMAGGVAAVHPSNFLLGDVNSDGVIDVLDIVNMVNFIMGNTSVIQHADVNNDGIVDVLDIVLVVNIIVG